jgi:hypothetical protein
VPLPLPRRAVGEAGDGDGGRGSAAAREEEGRLGMGGSATGGGFGVVGVDDAEGGSDAVAGGDAGLQQPAPHVGAIARGSTGRTADHGCRRCLTDFLGVEMEQTRI